MKKKLDIANPKSSDTSCFMSGMSVTLELEYRHHTTSAGLIQRVKRSWVGNQVLEQFWNHKGGIGAVV